MKNNLTSVLLFIIKLVLGITFIYSSYHKIDDPAGFAKILYGYGLFPEFSINILAICVPFIELTSGFCLIFGLFPRSALLIINLLMFFFIILITVNLIRGHQFDCGCFSSLSTQNQTLLSIYSLIRDVILLAAGIFLFEKAYKPH